VHGAGGIPDTLLGLATRHPPAYEHPSCSQSARVIGALTPAPAAPASRSRAARALYAKLGYAEDESSPGEEEAAGYCILLRRLSPAPAAAVAAAPLRPVTNSYQLEQLIFS